MSPAQQVIKVTVGVGEVATQGGTGSQAGKVRGYRREGFYRFQELSDQGGEAAVPELSRRKPNLKHRGAPASAEAVVGIAGEPPAGGQLRAAND